MGGVEMIPGRTEIAEADNIAEPSDLRMMAESRAQPITHIRKGASAGFARIFGFQNGEAGEAEAASEHQLNVDL